MFLKYYYTLKPLLPRGIQIFLQRMYARRAASNHEDWPIMEKAANKKPEGWSGWPEGKDFALVLTHDIEWGKGRDKCKQVVKIEEERGVRSSFYFVPERYHVPADLRDYLTSRGFEVGVHGLKHDGKLYNSRKIFYERAVKINQYLKEWGGVGFRSPSVHHNLEWIRDLDIEYDASTFDTDPFQPQPDGVGTIFPFWVPETKGRRGYVELPYTLPQDWVLYIILRESNLDIWKKKADWIVQNGGMILINTHPDYMHFGDGALGREEYPSSYYEEFLDYILERYKGRFWSALPKDVARFINDEGYASPDAEKTGEKNKS